MRHVSFSDVNKRLKGLSIINSASSKTGIFSERARTINANIIRATDIKRYIESVATDNKAIVSFGNVLDLFDALTEVGTISDISKYGHYIAENVTHRVRDAKATESLVKRRLTVLQNKLKTSTTPTNSNSSTNNTKNKAIQTAYESMLESLIIYANCDRMLENYNRISKRFNLEAVITENTKANGVYDTIIELCNRVDTYDMPTIVKFNTVIETAFYGFESNSIEYNKSEILQAACDYFLFKENGLANCKEILDATLFYDKDEDTNGVDVLTEDEPEDNSKTPSVDDMIRSKFASDSNSSIRENVEFSEIFEKFKKEELEKEHPENKLRGLITKLYSRNVNSIVNETPDLLRWIRSFFIIGTMAVPFIGPILGIISYIADRFIQLNVDAEEAKKMAAAFGNEINKTNTKLESITDPDEKDRLEKYIKALEQARDKISMYQMEITDDFEIDEKYEKYEPVSKSSTNDLFGDEEGEEFNLDIDEDFGDIDFEFNESLQLMNKYINNSNTLFVTEDFIYSLPKKVNNEVLIDIAECAKLFPEEFYIESLKEGINDELSRLRKDSSISVLAKYEKSNLLEGALEILSNTQISGKEISNIKKSNIILASLIEMYEAINIIRSTYGNDYKETVLEASFGNALKVASMKLKNAFNNLSVKEKSISKSIDLGVNNFKKGVERSLTNDNRESIIKGSILPSASKVIKLGIVNAGVSVFIHPILAVIGTLGYLGCSAKFKHKERQMLLDEIEIEIEMCEKYIQIAEQKNDMKALKQLLITKRDLERQRQRIKYKMKVELGQKYYDPKNVGDR